MVALIVSSLPPLLWSLAEFVRRRRVDALSILVLTGIALCLLAKLKWVRQAPATFQETRLGIDRHHVPWLGRDRPFADLSAARAALVRKSPDEVAASEAKRDTPRFDRVITIMTLVRSIGLLASSELACVLFFTPSILDYMLVRPLVGYGSIGALALWTAW